MLLSKVSRLTNLIRDKDHANKRQYDVVALSNIPKGYIIGMVQDIQRNNITFNR